MSWLSLQSCRSAWSASGLCLVTPLGAGDQGTWPHGAADRYLRSLFMAGELAVIRYAKTRHQASPMAHGIAGAATGQGRCHRACQQDCANGLVMMARGERYKQPVALAA